MRENVMRSVALAFVAFATAACTGGPGTVTGVDDAYEPFPGRRESPGSDREQPSSVGTDPARPNNERPPRNGFDVPPGGGGGGGGGASGALQCTGEFECVGGEEPSTIRLSLEDGVCSAGKSTVLESNGTITSKGETIGSWTLTGNGFTVTTGQGSLTCTRK